MAGSIRYIKIAKIDKNGVDLTTQLESINTLILPSASKFVEYNILNKSRFNDYFLYYVTPPNRENIDNDITSSLKYDFTGSMSTSTVTTPLLTVNALPISSSDSDNLGFFNSTTNTYNINTLPQKDLTVQIQGNLTLSGDFFDSVSVGIYKLSPTTTYYDDVILGELISQTFNANAGSTSINKTFTIPKENINPGDQLSIRTRKVSGGFLNYNITFGSGAKFKVSSTPATGTTKQAIIEPYFTTDFYKSEYDVLQNNAIKGIPNQLIQEIDYNSGIIPTNIQAIISGSAVKADIPQSYFEVNSVLNPSYNRSIIQSSDFNIFNPLARGTDFFDSVNIGNFGQTPSVSSLDVNIYEFEWGGGTTPEILDYGAVKMGRILQVSSPEQVKTINPSDGISSNILATFAGDSNLTARNYRQNVANNLTPTNTMSIDLGGGNDAYFWLTTQSISDYYQILNGNNPVNSEISMYMYPNSTAGSNPTLPATTKILNTEWGVPTISNYALTSSNSTVYGTIGNIGGADNLILLNRNIHISKVTTDSNGFYQSGKNPIKPNWATLGDQIVADLQNGEKWFVTLYNEFEFPNGEGDYNTPLTSGSLSPYNKGYTTRDAEGNYPNPLANKGVHEIIGAYDNFGSNQFFLLLKNPIPSPTKNIGGGTSGNSLGMLIWKARATDKGEFVLVQDSITGGVQAGAFTSKYSPNYITENFESITKEYGSNQTG